MIDSETRKNPQWIEADNAIEECAKWLRNTILENIRKELNDHISGNISSKSELSDIVKHAQLAYFKSCQQKHVFETLTRNAAIAISNATEISKEKIGTLFTLRDEHENNAKKIFDEIEYNFKLIMEWANSAGYEIDQKLLKKELP